jgi:hypothetical protein
MENRSIGPITFAPFVANAPTNPDWITGEWTGERLNMDYVLLAVESREILARQATLAAV